MSNPRLNRDELRLLANHARGLGQSQSAAEMGMDSSAWRWAQGGAMRKLRAKTPAHAVALAIGLGLLPASVATAQAADEAIREAVGGG